MSMITSEMLNAKQPVPPFLVRRFRTAQNARSPSSEEASFALRRHSIVRSSSQAPLERVAALLVAISRNNEYEGRDRRTIPDSLTCGFFVAQLLGIEVPVLADLLVSLERQGLVASTPPSVLELTNLAGLERLADAR